MGFPKRKHLIFGIILIIALDKENYHQQKLILGKLYISRRNYTSEEEIGLEFEAGNFSFTNAKNYYRLRGVHRDP